MSPKDKHAGSTSSLHQKLHQEGDEPTEQENIALLEHPSYIELQNKLTEAEKIASEAQDRMLRMQAENENVRRRVERDIANAHKYGLEKMALELLPVIDSLERALTLATSNDDPVLQGVEMTLQMMYTALKKFGIEQVSPEGDTFNPDLHQAVSTQVDPSVQPNTVVGVLQKGYLLNGRLVRPALVVVSKAN